MKKYLTPGLIISFLVSGCATMTPEELVAKYAPNGDIPISITDFGTSSNRVDGYSVSVGFVNTSKSTYKYVNLKFSARNKVGDPVASDIDGQYEKWYQTVGPFKYGQVRRTYDAQSTPLWYNSTIKCVVLEGVEIVLDNNTTKTFNFEETKKLIYGGNNMRCGPA